MAINDGDFEVPQELNNKPLDGVLKQLITGVSWGNVRDLIRSGKVLINGKVVTETTRPVSASQQIAIRMRNRRIDTNLPIERNAIVYVDDHVVVVEKPANMSTVPFEPEERGTLDQLVRALLTKVNKSRGGRVQGTLGVVHRLDKDTTGLLIFARTLAAKKHLAQQFRVHSVQRRYVAICHGEVDKRTIRTRFVADRGDGLRGSTSLTNQGVEAITHVNPLRALNNATLVECKLETGKTHQIRIHLSEQGHPLVGEKVYIRDFRGQKIRAPRIMLHAVELGFVHPTTGKQMFFESKLPDDMQELIDKLSAPKG